MMSRFCRYVEKVFDFGQRVKAIQDTRQKPRIPTAAIWLSAFLMFATRRGSLNAIESELFGDQPSTGSQQGVWQRRAVAVCGVGWA
jgi:hypothetical protein